MNLLLRVWWWLAGYSVLLYRWLWSYPKLATQVETKVMSEKRAERLAQAALRGFFGDPIGFRDMNMDRITRAAVKAVEKVLQDESQEVRGIGERIP